MNPGFGGLKNAPEPDKELQDVLVLYGSKGALKYPPRRLCLTGSYFTPGDLFCQEIFWEK